MEILSGLKVRRYVFETPVRQRNASNGKALIL